MRCYLHCKAFAYPGCVRPWHPSLSLWKKKYHTTKTSNSMQVWVFSNKQHTKRCSGPSESTDQSLPIFDLMVILWVYTYVKTYQNVYFLYLTCCMSTTSHRVLRMRENNKLSFSNLCQITSNLVAPAYTLLCSLPSTISPSQTHCHFGTLLPSAVPNTQQAIQFCPFVGILIILPLPGMTRAFDQMSMSYSYLPCKIQLWSVHF